MSERTNPYQAPQGETLVYPASTDWRRAAKVFVAWLAGASLLSGAGRALQAGYALRTFAIEHFVPLIMEVGALRVWGAQVAASAASVAFVASLHRPASTSTDARGAPVPWQLYAAVPLAAPVSGCIMIIAGGGVTALVFNVVPAEYWKGIGEHAVVTDPLCGAAVACLYAVALGAVAAAAGRRLSAMRRGLVVKIIIALFVTSLIVGVIGAVLDAALWSEADPLQVGLPALGGRSRSRQILFTVAAVT